MSRIDERRLPLGLSSEDAQLQKVVRDYVSNVLPQPTGDRPTWDDLDPDGRLWRRTAAEIGLQGLGVAEDLGGQGFGVAELAIVFHELGRVTCAAPLFGSVALAGRVLAHLPPTAERDRVLRGIADGTLRASAILDGGLAFAEDGTVSGQATAVIDATTADVFVVLVENRVYGIAADAPGVTVEPQHGMDLTRDLGRVHLTGAAAIELGTGSAAVTRGVTEAIVLLAAELTGVAEAALADAVEYAKIRTQFGRPIGSFQSLKHRMADMLVATEGARSLTRHAALLCDVTDPVASPAELAVAASTAKSSSAAAATFATGENIQIHGGIGFTWEHSAHLRFRRSRSAAALLGSPSEHRRKVADILTGGNP